MKIELVKQEDDFGCAAACIAMVLGKTYREITKDFQQDFNKKGLPGKKIIEYLAFAGCNIISKTVEYFNDKDFGRDEILKPFAPAHIVTVRQYFDREISHAVVMDSKGRLFCPQEVDEATIKSSYRIDKVIGIYK